MVYTSEWESGPGPDMLQRVLTRLHIRVRPLYFVTKIVDPPHTTLYKAKVHLRDTARGGNSSFTFAIQ